jgi:hypothetical protein
MNDLITSKTLEIIQESNEVLETKEILEKLLISSSDVTRTKLFSRLNNLRGEGLIKGKFVGSGKGVWIWWKKSLILENKSSGESKI